MAFLCVFAGGENAESRSIAGNIVLSSDPQQLYRSMTVIAGSKHAAVIPLFQPKVKTP